MCKSTSGVAVPIPTLLLTASITKVVVSKRTAFDKVEVNDKGLEPPITSVALVKEPVPLKIPFPSAPLYRTPNCSSSICQIS